MQHITVRTAGSKRTQKVFRDAKLLEEEIRLLVQNAERTHNPIERTAELLLQRDEVREGMRQRIEKPLDRYNNMAYTCAELGCIAGMIAIILERNQNLFIGVAVAFFTAGAFAMKVASSIHKELIRLTALLSDEVRRIIKRLDEVEKMADQALERHTSSPSGKLQQ